MMVQYNSKAVLVVGGAGYIGSHTAKYLHQRGYTPIVYDNLSRGHREFAKWGPFVEASLGDKKALAQAIRTHKPQSVIHLAAYAYVNESVHQPALYYRNNVLETLALLEVMLELEVPHFVFSSTCATYGIPEKSPITEDAPQSPINPYGRSKLMVEQILKDLDEAHGLRCVSLRYFNAAGADPGGEIGEHHDPETHLIPVLLDAASGKRPSLSVFGTDYPTPDGTCVRDYIHVNDLADAHIRAVEYLAGGGSSLFCNLGAFRGHSIKEVIACAEKVTGKKIPVSYEDRREGDPPELVCAPGGPAEKILGWKPAHSDLENILRTAWHWHQKKESRFSA